MPELDGTSVIAILSFVALIVAWLMAPASARVSVKRELPAAA